MLRMRCAPQNWCFQLLASVLAMIFASSAVAETVYVTDVLRLGIHADKSLNSPITTLVQSGTPLEVLAREDKLVQVKSPGGTVGWVDASLVQTEPTARAALDSLRRQTSDGQKTETALKAQVESLNQRLERTEQQLQRTEQQRLAAESARTDLQARLDTQQQNAPNPEVAAAADAKQAQLSQQLSETLREVETLAAENQRLQKLLEAQALEAATPSASSPPPAKTQAQDPGLMNVLNWALWQQVLLISGCVLAFSLGAYFVDWNARRRHGGFRI